MASASLDVSVERTLVQRESDGAWCGVICVYVGGSLSRIIVSELEVE
ncbi:MAG TPA: hypothetical protein VNG04_04630 [Candidatus Acidoferrum sp.]|nr:hypothetical protein [Candidatus Acidoferrum sp.]